MLANMLKYIHMKNITKILFVLIVLTSCSSNKLVNHNWEGKWVRQEWQNNATLEITKVTADYIDFFILAHSGAHTGEIEGKASIRDTIAIFSSQDDMEECTIEFRLIGDSIIIVNQKEGHCLAGLGVTYSGKYVNSKLITKKSAINEDLISLDILTSQEDSAFRELVGNSYDLFVKYTHLIYQDDDIDSLKMKVISSGVRGMFTYMEYIIMVDSQYRFCAAVIDNNKVLYFSNIEAFKNQLPKTIEKWRERFKEYEVIYNPK